MMNLQIYTKMPKPKHHKSPISVITPEPEALGLKMLTYAQMREHKHKEKPPCASHNIDAVLALIPKDQQSQFVRAFPRPQPRYANRPTGVSMFREEMDKEMTVHYRDSADQPRPSPDSMVMAPRTAGDYIGTRSGEQEEKKDGQFCMPQVATAVSTFFSQAVKAVTFQPALSSTNVVDLATENERVPNSSDGTVKECIDMPQPPPPVVVPIQRSNAIRYRAHPRPRPHIRKDSCLGHYPGGEADSYYLSEWPVVGQKAERGDHGDASREMEVPCERPAHHPTRPDSPFPKPQQRNLPSVTLKNNPRTPLCHDFSAVDDPKLSTYINEATDGPHPPPLRRTNSKPSMANMPGLPPPIQCDGCLRWPDLGALKIPLGPALTSPSSSCRLHLTTEAKMPEDMPDEIPEAVSAFRRSSPCGTPSDSPSSGYRTKTTTETTISDGISDGIPEALPTSRRFSLDEFTLAEAIPAKHYFSISAAESRIGSAERLSSRFPVVPSSHEHVYDYQNDADHETDGDTHPPPPGTHSAPLCTSPMRSVPTGSLPTLWYYEYAVSSVPPAPQDDKEVPKRHLCDNTDPQTNSTQPLVPQPRGILHLDMHAHLEEPCTSHADPEPGSCSSSSSIDQSLFADFAGDFTATATATATSPLTSAADKYLADSFLTRQRIARRRRVKHRRGEKHR